MTSEKIDVVEYLAVLKLEPGDVLVLTCPDELTPEQAQELRARLAEAVPGFQAVVLSGGVQLGAVRQADT